MKKILALMGIGVLSLALALPALAAEFSADVVRKAMGREMSGKILVKDKNVRMEGMRGPMGPGYTIVRGDRKLLWMVSPDQKTYMEISMESGVQAPTQQPQTDEKMPGEVSRKELGRETLDGHPCIKYEIVYKLAEQSHVIHQWVAQDLKLPLKTAAVDDSWSVEYKNVKKGSVPDSAFEVPGDYQKSQMPAIPGMGQGMRPGMGGQGMKRQAPPEDE
jgi:hypothetical protein